MDIRTPPATADALPFRVNSLLWAFLSSINKICGMEYYYFAINTWIKTKATGVARIIKIC